MNGNHVTQPGRSPGDRPPAGEDLVERLVRLADAGPAPPPEETDRLKARLRPLWRREVHARSRRRLLWTTGTLAAAAMLFVVFSRVLQVGTVMAPPPLAPVAIVTTIVGRADVTLLSGVRAPRGPEAVGMALAPGTIVECGATDRLALRLAGGQSLRLDVTSRVRLDSGAAVTLERGAVYVDSSAGGDSVAVRTAFGEARDIGTQFEARLAGDALTVGVREGVVLVSGAGERLMVESGDAVTVAPGRAPERRPIAAWGQEWEWTQAVAPLLDIEGRTAREFLAWVARESGIEVSYADARAERAAREAVLHGRLVGPTPLESLAVVLPGCGLRSARSDGRIVISAGAVPLV